MTIFIANIDSSIYIYSLTIKKTEAQNFVHIFEHEVVYGVRNILNFTIIY